MVEDQRQVGEALGQADRLAELVAPDQEVVSEPVVTDRPQPPFHGGALQPLRVRLVLDDVSYGAQVRATGARTQFVEDLADGETGQVHPADDRADQGVLVGQDEQVAGLR